MFKVRTVVKAPLDVAIMCGCDFEVRQEWDNVLFDYRIFEQKKEVGFLRYAYTFKAVFPASDRDFYLQQRLVYDFPELGMVTLAVHSLPYSDEYPLQPRKVRGTIQISMVMKAIKEQTTGEEHTEIWMTNMCDPNGLVPKWLVNMASKSVPKLWFKTYEQGCHKYMKKNFK